DISRLITRGVPPNSPRDRPMAARVPKTIASRVAAGATIMLFFSERIHSSEVKKVSYQRREKPCSGYTRKLPELNDSGTITSTGRIRNSSTSAHRLRWLQNQARSMGDL